MNNQMSLDTIDEELLSQRKLLLFGDIDEQSSLKIIKELLYLSKRDDPITIFVCSDGGDVPSSSAIIDMVNAIKSKIIIKMVCFKAGSSAADIVSIGTKGFRYCFPNSVLMLHKMSIELGMDNENNQEAYLEFNKKRSMATNSMIAKACGQKIDKFIKDITNDMWLDAEDAKKYKIIDKIIKDISEIYDK